MTKETELKFERVARSLEAIVVVKPSRGRMDYILSCAPEEFVGLKRMHYVLGALNHDRKPIEINGQWCLFLPDGEALESALIENYNLPIPFQKLNFGDPSDYSAERSIQRAYQWRCGEVKRLRKIHQRIMDRWSAKEGFEAGRPLRVLFVSSIFSTVLQYMSRDMAWGFEQCGHQARIVHEKAQYQRSSGIDLWRSLVEWKPHIVFRMDHLRTEMEDPYEKIYSFSWLQDDLPNLWHPEYIKRLGPFDYTMCMFPRLALECVKRGYPPGNTFTLPVAANMDIFRPGPVSGEQYDLGFPCNISSPRTLSNPEFLKRRLEPLIWAMQSGAKVRVWGKGWDQFPDFRSIWGGPVENGPDLAAAYRSCKLTLHTNFDTNMHQRVVEAYACHSLPMIYSLPSDAEEMGLKVMYDTSRLLFFADEADFKKKLIYILNVPHERHRMTQYGYAHTVANNTYRHRVEAVLKQLGYGKKREGLKVIG